jgi:hypothetical protein
MHADFCPVCSAAALVTAIIGAALAQQMPFPTPINFVQPGGYVLPVHVLHAVQCRACLTTDNGYNLARIGAHSLWASGE